MQADEEVGKIAQAVPVIISRTLELFVESLLTKSSSITNSRNAKTLSPSHLKQCIMSESRFDFLKDLVKLVPDIAMEEGSLNAQNDQPLNLAMPSASKLSKSLSKESEPTKNRTVLGNGTSEVNGLSRALQRSQSLQPTSTAAIATTSVSTQSQYHHLQQQKFYLNNYTNHQNTSSHKPNNELRAPHPKVSRLNSTPASATITSEQQQPKHLPAPLNFPIQISYNIDGSSAGSAIESPAVKIDYSKFTLPATSPSIKIDLSNFNQQVTKSTNSSSCLDEDYDI